MSRQGCGHRPPALDGQPAESRRERRQGALHVEDLGKEGVDGVIKKHVRVGCLPGTNHPCKVRHPGTNAEGAEDEGLVRRQDGGCE